MPVGVAAHNGGAGADGSHDEAGAPEDAGAAREQRGPETARPSALCEPQTLLYPEQKLSLLIPALCADLNLRPEPKRDFDCNSDLQPQAFALPTIPCTSIAHSTSSLASN